MNGKHKQGDGDYVEFGAHCALHKHMAKHLERGPFWIILNSVNKW